MAETLEGELAEAARRSDEMREEARRLLTAAVRRGRAAGMSQREIARAVGRSQPEVLRLLRFRPLTERGRDLAARRHEVLERLAAVGLQAPRVFGSVARGEDGPGSDVDLVVTPTRPISLFALARVEREIADLVGSPVDLVLDTQLTGPVRERVLAEAAAL